jgi:MFS family permease
VLFGKWPVLHMMLGVTIASFGSYGSGAFVPSYFVRTFGLGLAQVGLIVGLIGGFSAGIGTLVGGFLTDWAGKRSAKWYALVPAIGLLICTPIYIVAYLQTDWQTTALILLVPGIFHYTYLAPTFGVVQNSVEPRRRATATALLFFFLNLIALGGGPVFTGWLIDHLAQYNFNTPDAGGLISTLGGSFGRPRAANFAPPAPAAWPPRARPPNWPSTATGHPGPFQPAGHHRLAVLLRLGRPALRPGGDRHGQAHEACCSAPWDRSPRVLRSPLVLETVCEGRDEGLFHPGRRSPSDGQDQSPALEPK